MGGLHTRSSRPAKRHLASGGATVYVARIDKRSSPKRLTLAQATAGRGAARMGKAWAPESAAGAASPAKPPRSAAYWTAAMAGQGFAGEDRLDTARDNRALWRGLEGDAPYPTRRDGRDLRENRAALLAAARIGGCS
jgi:hypothetical protein